MSLSEIYQSWGAPLYYCAVAVLFLLLGVFSGWILWWTSARRHGKAIEDLDVAKREVDYAKAENIRLRHRLDQLESLSPEEEAVIEAKLSFEGATGDGDSSPTCKDAAARSRERLHIEPPTASGPHQTESDSRGIDWSKFDGMNPKLLTALSERGIKNIDQLESLTADERAGLEHDLAANGIQWNWGMLANWRVAVAAATAADSTDDCSSRKSFLHASASTAALANSPPVSVDWSKLDGVNQQLADGLNELGYENVWQLETLSGDERTDLEEELSEKNASIDWGKLANWKSAEAAIKAARTFESAAKNGSRENQNDSRSSPPVHSHFNERLVRVDSEAPPHPPTSSMSKRAAAKLAKKRAPHVMLAADPVHSSRRYLSKPAESENNTVLGFAAHRSHETSENTSPTDLTEQQPLGEVDDSGMPVFDLEMPRVQDDLTLLDGIESEQAEALHRMGIRDFDQLHDLHPRDRDRLQSWFHLRGWHLDMDQWRIASEGNTLDPTMEEIQQKAYELYCYRDHHGLKGDEKTDWDQAEWELRGNPIFGYGIPHHVDDFAAPCNSLTEDARDELYRMGLYNDEQINALDADERRMLTRWFAGPRFRLDLTTALESFKLNA